jgi:hypothetical protein
LEILGLDFYKDIQLVFPIRSRADSCYVMGIGQHGMVGVTIGLADYAEPNTRGCKGKTLLICLAPFHRFDTAAANHGMIRV